MFFKTLAGVAFFGLAAGGAIAETKLDMTNEYEPNSIHGQGDQFFADKVAELSGGDVIITLHLGGALGFTAEHVPETERRWLERYRAEAGIVCGHDQTAQEAAWQMAATGF